MARRSNTNDVTGTTVLSLREEIRSHHADLQSLSEKFPKWFQRFIGSSTDLVYAIPSKAIHGRSWLSHISESDLAAERAFADLCQRHTAVGVRDGDLIPYSRLFPAKSLVKPEIAQQLNWPAHSVSVLNAGFKKVQAADNRMLGIAGRLVTEPAFLQETGELQRQLALIPDELKPVWPMMRALPMSSIQGAEHQPLIQTFATCLCQFLDRWGLIALLDWDLPDPQGPLLPSLLPVNSLALPKHGVHLVIPVHYPMYGDDDLLREVKKAQAAAAKNANVPPELAGCPHHEQYSQMFRLILLEKAVRSRFPEKAPHGLVSAVENAAAEELSISLDTAKRLRKWITRCRAGNRHKIASLRD